MLRFFGSLLLLAYIAGTTTAMAEENTPIWIVVNIDTIPDNEAPAQKILQDYVRAQDAEAVDIRLIQEAKFPNHYIIEATFPTRADYDRFNADRATVSFRSELFPYLGSPWDERIGTKIAP